MENFDIANGGGVDPETKARENEEEYKTANDTKARFLLLLYMISRK